MVTRRGCTAEDLVEPGKHLYLGRDYKNYLNVDLFTAQRGFDFREAFSRSIAVEVVAGIQRGSRLRAISKGFGRTSLQSRPDRTHPPGDGHTHSEPIECRVEGNSTCKQFHWTVPIRKPRMQSRER